MSIRNVGVDLLDPQEFSKAASVLPIPLSNSPKGEIPMKPIFGLVHRLLGGFLVAVIFVSANMNPLFAEWVQTNGPYGGNISSFAVSGTNLFAGTFGGSVWRRPLSEMISSIREIEASELPRIFELKQNYPNPFNPTTVIRFQVSGVSNVRLVVYDLLGREVAVLVDEKKTPGSYETTFDARGLASGVYFYRLQSGDYTETKRLILLR